MRTGSSNSASEAKAKGRSKLKSASHGSAGKNIPISTASAALAAPLFQFRVNLPTMLTAPLMRTRACGKLLEFRRKKRDALPGHPGLTHTPVFGVERVALRPESRLRAAQPHLRWGGGAPPPGSVVAQRTEAQRRGPSGGFRVLVPPAPRGRSSPSARTATFPGGTAIFSAYALALARHPPEVMRAAAQKRNLRLATKVRSRGSSLVRFSGFSR